MGIKRAYRYNKETRQCERILTRRDREHFHHIIDDIRELKSPITGETIDSLSKYKAHIKEHGYEITGGEHFTGRGINDFKPSDIINEAEMRDASLREMNSARWGMMPCTELEKEKWTEESKMMNGKSNNLMDLKMRGVEEMSKKTGIPKAELLSKMRRSC